MKNKSIFYCSENKTFRTIPKTFKLAETSGDEAPNAPSEIQLMKTGSFEYDDGITLNINDEVFNSFIKNFKGNARGIDLAIDFGHNAYGEAAAWIKDIEVKNNSELWAKVDWTRTGKEKVEGKEYRYLSAEFVLEEYDDEGSKIGPTLYGGGLTNRPFLKGMQATVLSENKKRKIKMEEKIAEIIAMLTAMKSKVDDMGERINKVEQALEGKKEEEMAEDKEKMGEQKELSERTKQFDKMLSEGKVVESQREAYIKNDAITFSLNAKVLNLDAKGEGDDIKEKQNKEEKVDIEQKILELAEKKAKEENIPLNKAISVVLSENKKLSEERSKKYKMA